MRTLYKNISNEICLWKELKGYKKSVIVNGSEVNKEITLKLLTHDRPMYYSHSAVRVQKEKSRFFTQHDNQPTHLYIQPLQVMTLCTWSSWVVFWKLETSSLQLWATLREPFTACSKAHSRWSESYLQKSTSSSSSSSVPLD